MVSSHFHNGNGRQSPPGRQSIHVLLRRLLPVPFFRIPDQKEIIALFASFNAAVCCRRTDAFQIPVPVPAARFAALSHMLINGFFIVRILARQCSASWGFGVLNECLHVVRAARWLMWMKIISTYVTAPQALHHSDQ